MTVNLSIPRLVRFSDQLSSVRVRKETITNTVLMLLVMINFQHESLVSKHLWRKDVLSRTLEQDQCTEKTKENIFMPFYEQGSLERLPDMTSLTSLWALCDMCNDSSVTWFTVSTYDKSDFIVNPDRLCDMCNDSSVTVITCEESQVTCVIGMLSHVTSLTSLWTDHFGWPALWHVSW